MASTNKFFTNLSVAQKDIRDLRELIPMSIFQDEDFNKFVTLRKVQNGDPVGLIGDMDAVGFAGADCDPTYVETGIANAQKRWALGDWHIPIKICYDALQGTIAEWQLKTGTDVADLTSTEFMTYIIRPALEKAMRTMIWRIGWFGDTSAAVIASGGVLTAGTDPNLFKSTDGFWKKLFAIGTATAAQVTAISANTATAGSPAAITSAAQKAAILTQGVATDIFDSMIMDADSRITADPDSIILCTKALADALTYDVKKVHHQIMPWEAVFEGVKISEYGGYKIAAISIWDRMINAYENASTYLNKPYRAVFVNPKNLQVGTNADSLISDLDVWFDHKERRNYIYATGKIGTMVLEDSMVHLAY